MSLKSTHLSLDLFSVQNHDKSSILVFGWTPMLESVLRGRIGSPYKSSMSHTLKSNNISMSPAIMSNASLFRKAFLGHESIIKTHGLRRFELLQNMGQLLLNSTPINKMAASPIGPGYVKISHFDLKDSTKTLEELAESFKKLILDISSRHESELELAILPSHLAEADLWSSLESQFQRNKISRKLKNYQPQSSGGKPKNRL